MATAIRKRLKRTERGFRRGEFVDLYGSTCSLQESSLATDRAIWLGVDEPSPEYKVNHRGVRMHLSQRQVAKLLPHLQKFVETGEL